MKTNYKYQTEYTISRSDVDGVNIKYVPNTMDMFAVSKDGEVYSFSYKMMGRKISSLGYGGYMTCSVQYVNDKGENLKRKTVYVHRLVAEAFIPNPEGKKQVCHINENRADNRVENLCWVAAKEVGDKTNHNQKLSSAIKEYYKARGKFGLAPVRVAIINPETQEVLEISPSIKAAGRWIAKKTGKVAGSSALQVSGILAGKVGFRTCGGYGARKATEEEYKAWAAAHINEILEEVVDVSEVQMKKLNNIPGVSVINRRMDVATGEVVSEVKKFEVGEKIINELK